MLHQRYVLDRCDANTFTNPHRSYLTFTSFVPSHFYLVSRTTTWSCLRDTLFAPLALITATSSHRPCACFTFAVRQGLVLPCGNLPRSARFPARSCPVDVPARANHHRSAHFLPLTLQIFPFPNQSHLRQIPTAQRALCADIGSSAWHTCQHVDRLQKPRT